MATISATVRSIILADTTIASLIETRCYILAFPADPTFPLIVYRQVGESEILRSAPKGTVNLSTRFQVDIFGETYSGAQALRTPLVNLFTGYKGTVSGHVILSSRIDLAFDIYENDTGLYRHTVDFSIQHVGA